MKNKLAVITVNMFVVFFLLYIESVSGQVLPCYQFPEAGNDHSQSLGVVQLSIDVVSGVTETVYVSGPTVISRSYPMIDSTGKKFIETEIVEMNLHGKSSILGPLRITLHPEIPSMGRIMDSNPDPELDFPADSFFDVFIQVTASLFGAEVNLFNEEPLHVQAQILCIPPIGTAYRHRFDNGGVKLLDSRGVALATIIQAAHKLENPLFSVVPGGNLDLASLGPFNFTGRSFFGAGIVESAPPAFGWPPVGRIEPALLGLFAGTPDTTDNIDALSFGMDDVLIDSLDIAALSFSVDNASIGAAGTSVNFEVTTGSNFGAPDAPAPPEHMADIFLTPLNGQNLLMFDEKDATCLIANMTVTNRNATASNCLLPGNPPGWPGGNNPEDTDALEFGNVFFVGNDNNFDARLDQLVSNIYFSFDARSVSIGMTVADFRPGPVDGVASPDDILMAGPPGGSFGVFASGVLDIGLDKDDDLDALCLQDTTQLGFLNPGQDFALFSLAPGSPSLGSGLSPADVFFTDFTGTFSLFSQASELGLLSQDNIDALDCQILIDRKLPTSIRPHPQGQNPNNFSLHQNYPNPFNASTTITFDLPNGSYVTVKIFDILGKEVSTLVDEELPPGQYRAVWNAYDIANGVYFYIIKAGTFVETRKLILLK